MKQKQISLARRKALQTVLTAAAMAYAGRLVNAAEGESASSQLPVWTGFGLNGSAGQTRFDLTREYVKKKGMQLSDSDAFKWFRDELTKTVRDIRPAVVQFKTEVQFGENLLIGFAHDYEIAIGARLENASNNANTIMIFMSGVGLVLGYDSGSSWRIVSSFPFMFRFERLEKDLKNVRGKAVDKMGEAYLGYAKGYAHFLSRFNKWGRGYKANYFARVTLAEIHKELLPKLEQLRIDKIFNREFVGFSASSSICDHLDVPLLPFQENDALAKRYAVKFTDDLRAQDVANIPDADLKFEVIIRDVEKQVVPSKQMGITIIRRQVVINFRVRDGFSPSDAKPLFQTFAAAGHDEDKIPHGSTEDDTPDRDVVFFDRLLTRTLSFLLRGIVANDPELLKQANVKYDVVAGSIPKLLELCAKTRG